MTAPEVRSAVSKWAQGRITNVDIGLPEYDDRLNLWRVSLLALHNGREPVAEVRVDNKGIVVFTSDLSLVAERCRQAKKKVKGSNRTTAISFCPVESRIVLGDSVEVLADHPPDSVQLIFTSPPYFNAKPEYHESVDYEAYLLMLRKVFQGCHDVLSEGRFLVVNTSPVLVRRAHRQAASRRYPIPFDLHRVLDDIGFDFVDDIIWQKPEGAGWHLGRGRRFSADRQPLQYKAVTVTENIVVYRKRTDKLIDWNLRQHPDQRAVHESLIGDGYERTNIWQIHPASRKDHPAVFPEALVERVKKYYSFKRDMVLDPFAGVGTVGRVAHDLERRFMLVEKSPQYFDIIRCELADTHPLVSYEWAAGAL